MYLFRGFPPAAALVGSGLVPKTREFEVGAYSPKYISSLYLQECTMLRMHTYRSHFKGFAKNNSSTRTRLLKRSNRHKGSQQNRPRLTKSSF